MHVGFLTLEYPPFPSGGIGTSISNLTRALVAMGHRATVVGWGPAGEFDDGGVKVRFLGDEHPPKLGWLVNRRRARDELRRLVRDEGLDIVEAHDWGGPSAGIRLSCPIVVRCHGSAKYFGHLLSEKVRPSVVSAERVALRQASGVAAVSSFTADVTESLFDVVAPIEVIPNGVDVSRFNVDPKEGVAPVVLYLGTLVRKKGVLDFCRAFSRVAGAVPEARARLVGGDSRDSATGAASTWSLCRDLMPAEVAGRVEYGGRVPYSEVTNAVLEASVCVFPSYAEAMPLTWLEAMACGKAIVAYDIGWAREVVVHGSTGLLVAPGNVGGLTEAVVGLLRDDGLRIRMGRAARARAVTEFSISTAAARTLEWYQRALDGLDA